MSGTIFMMMAANGGVAEQPVEGETGVWLYTSNGGAVVASGMSVTYADGIGVNYSASFARVCDRGILDGAAVWYWGNLHISSGGTTTALTVVQNGANATVLAGGTALNTTVSGGRLYVRGRASNVVVSGGSLVVSSGGTALAVASMTGATVIVSNGGYIEYA